MRGIGLIIATALAAVNCAAAADPLSEWRAPQIDFSHAGYHGGGVAPPIDPATIVVAPADGDDGDRIQAAVALVESGSADARGHRGVVQLLSGEYQIEGQIRLSASGVVLRGVGAGEGGTTIRATGVDRRAVIVVAGADRPATGDATPDVAVAAPVAVGASRLSVADGSPFSVGDRVTVRRPSTAAWITALGMDAFVGWRPESRLNWKPGSRDVVWDRTVVRVEGDDLWLDAPLTTALDPAMGGGLVVAGVSTPRIREVGVEGLSIISASDPTRPRDEDHSWFAIAFDRVEDGWIRNIAASGFVSSVVDLGETTRRITVQDVSASTPVSEIGGYRRRVFYTAGQQTLFVRCDSRDGIHDFGMGHAAAGPNVFLDCTATDALGDSGPLESWASGALFDGVKVRGGGLRLTNRGRDGQGAGWAAANALLWNCEATVVEVRNPPGASNAAIGCRGERVGDGVLEDARVQPGRDFYRAAPQRPASLYRAQLANRLGEAALAALDPVVLPPPSETVRRLSPSDVEAWRAARTTPSERHPLTLVDDEFRIDGQPAWRRRIGFSFFQAQMPSSLAPGYGAFLTRFAPGEEGLGLTDDLDAFAGTLSTGDVVTHNYGLWYDRRRVDHDFYGSPDQKDGEVWAPFIELPWARSGEGRAWDGLSKYDLTRFNPWFFQRLSDFADLAEQRGVVLYHRLYLQHWLLESRAHYVDFPWRPVNALQPTGLPWEVPAAETFWDVSDPVRRDLHRRYIRHTLDALRGKGNVVIGLDPEYTGPLAFVQFWLDEIAAWEKDNDASVWVALEAPKAVMDGVLDDPVRSRIIDAIGVHHWVYRPDGTLFAVEGGVNKAPREQVDAVARPQDLANGADPAAVRRDLWRGAPATRYRAYREYHDRRPDLAFLNADDAYPSLSKAVDDWLATTRHADLRPDPTAVQLTGSGWAMLDSQGNQLVYSLSGEAMTIRPLSTPALATWLTGGETVTSCLPPKTTSLSPPIRTEAWVVWLHPDAQCNGGSPP